MSRANTLSSSVVQRVEEEKKIVRALKENGYPSSFVRKHSCPTRHRQEVDDVSLCLGMIISANSVFCVECFI